MFKKMMMLLALCCSGMLVSNTQATGSVENPLQMESVPKLCEYMEKNPGVYVRVDTMHAGKTETCSEVKKLLEKEGKKVHVLRLLPENGSPDIQNGRDSDKSLNALSMQYGGLAGYLQKQSLNSSDNTAFIIDEVHFGKSEDVVNGCKLLKDKMVYVTGLKIDVYKAKFPSVIALEKSTLEKLTDVTFVQLPSKAYCSECKAINVELLDKRTIGGKLDVGGQDVCIPEGSDAAVLYLTLCENCIQKRTPAESSSTNTESSSANTESSLANHGSLAKYDGVD